MLPDMCMVEQRGITKPATSSETPFLRVWASVTGIVAADDCVPKAVIYAGIMFHSSFKGFFPAKAPAMENCSRSIPMCRTNIIPMIFMKTFIIGNTCPAMVISMNMPKIYSGSSGMTAVFIILVTTSPKSRTAFLRVLSPRAASPRPRVKESTSAVITFMSGGMLTVKNGVSPSASLTKALAGSGPRMNPGKKAAPVK